MIACIGILYGHGPDVFCRLLVKSKLHIARLGDHVMNLWCGWHMAQVQGARMLREEVTEQDIADIICMWTGIPVSKLVASEREKLLHLDEELHRRVIGQDEAVQAVADAIQRCAGAMLFVLALMDAVHACISPFHARCILSMVMKRTVLLIRCAIIQGTGDEMGEAHWPPCRAPASCFCEAILDRNSSKPMVA